MNAHNNIKTIRQQKNISREEMAEKLGLELSSYGKLERGDVSISLKRLCAIASIFNMEMEDILTYHKTFQGNAAYIPIKAQAGMLTEFNDKGELIPFDIPVFSEKNLLMIDVEGDSMSGLFEHGDYVFIKKVEDMNNIQYKKPYVIDTKEGRVIKRIDRHEDEDKFLLRSDNEMYEPYSILKKTILSLWEVKGFLSKNVAPKNFYAKRIQTLEDSISSLSKNMSMALGK